MLESFLDLSWNLPMAKPSKNSLHPEGAELDAVGRRDENLPGCKALKSHETELESAEQQSSKRRRRLPHADIAKSSRAGAAALPFPLFKEARRGEYPIILKDRLGAAASALRPSLPDHEIVERIFRHLPPQILVGAEREIG